MVASLGTAWVGGWTMVKLRERNARWAASVRSRVDAGEERAVVGLQVRGLTADYVRGALLTAISYAIFAPLAAWVISRWTPDARVSRAFVVGIASSVMLAAAYKVFHQTPGARWLLAAGLIAGFALVATR
jgi:hypothetical protein